MPPSNPKAFVHGKGHADKIAASDVAALGAKLKAAGFKASDLAAFLRAGATRGEVRAALIDKLRHAPKG